MPKKQDKITQPIDADFEDVTIAIRTDLAPGLKTIKNNDLNCKHMSLTPTPKQEEMFPVERQIEYQEIEEEKNRNLKEFSNVIFQDLTEEEKIKHLEKLLDLEKEGKIRLSTEIDYLNRQLDIKWYI